MQKTILIAACTFLNSTLVGFLVSPSYSQGQSDLDTPIQERTAKSAALVVRVSQASVSSLLNTEFEHEVSFERVILETGTQGNANCRGSLTSKLEVLERGVALCLEVSGTVYSDSVGKNGPASIAAKSQTDYVAKKRMAFCKGCFITQPATIESETKITISGVDTDLPGVRGVVVKRVAMRKAVGLRQEAERIVCELTNCDICKQIDQGVDDQIGYINYMLKNRRTSAFLILLTTLVKLRSDSECIEVHFGQATPQESDKQGTDNSEKNSAESLAQIDAAP